MKVQIDLLAKLQEKDIELVNLKSQIVKSPERLQALGKELKTLEEDIEADKNRVQELMRQQRQDEADIEDGLANIRKSKGRLMSIKSNKEYTATLKEIEDTERQKKEKEDAVLACLEEIEILNDQLKGKSEDLSAMRGAIESEKELVSREMAQLQERLSCVDKSRENLVATMDSQLIKRYERIMAITGGIAVSLVNNATCSECHINIPPQMYNELQKQNDLKFCPNCQRIIYWKKEDTEG